MAKFSSLISKSETFSFYKPFKFYSHLIFSHFFHVIPNFQLKIPITCLHTPCKGHCENYSNWFAIHSGQWNRRKKWLYTVEMWTRTRKPNFIKCFTNFHSVLIPNNERININTRQNMFQFKVCVFFQFYRVHIEIITSTLSFRLTKRQFSLRMQTFSYR